MPRFAAGRNSEALRDLQRLSTNGTVGLAASMAMLSAHKRAKTVDKDAVAALKSKVDDSVRSSSPEQLFHAALFLWHDGRHDKARDLANRLLKDDKSSVDGLTARGWINMTCGRESMSTKAPKDFTDAIDAADAAGSFGVGLMAKIGMIWCVLTVTQYAHIHTHMHTCTHTPITHVHARLCIKQMEWASMLSSPSGTTDCIAFFDNICACTRALRHHLVCAHL